VLINNKSRNFYNHSCESHLFLLIGIFLARRDEEPDLTCVSSCFGGTISLSKVSLDLSVRESSFLLR
jgi:hypothetical protein